MRGARPAATVTLERRLAAARAAGLTHRHSRWMECDETAPELSDKRDFDVTTGHIWTVRREHGSSFNPKRSISPRTVSRSPTGSSADASTTEESSLPHSGRHMA